MKVCSRNGELFGTNAREYVRSLESFYAAQKFACGFSPNEMYRRKMPVILHISTAAFFRPPQDMARSSASAKTICLPILIF